MGKLTVEIPEDVARALRVPPAEREQALRQELAISLYARGILGFSKARELAKLTRWQFEELLGRRGVVRQYTKEDLGEDLEHDRSGQ
jgi:predicted HTH domain antitoxin